MDVNKINEKFEWWYRHTSLSKEHNPAMLGQNWIREVALEGFEAGVNASQPAVALDKNPPCAYDHAMLKRRGYILCEKCLKDFYQ